MPPTWYLFLDIFGHVAFLAFNLALLNSARKQLIPVWNRVEESLIQHYPGVWETRRLPSPINLLRHFHDSTTHD